MGSGVCMGSGPENHRVDFEGAQDCFTNRFLPAWQAVAKQTRLPTPGSHSPSLSPFARLDLRARESLPLT